MWIDAVGYLASCLVLVTFCMHTMVSLRAVAICSNVAFVVYGISAAVYPVLVLHLILFPLNIAHFLRMILILRRARFAANTDLSPNWLQPFMRLQRVRAGATIFERGDYANALYLIVSGEVELPEIREVLRPGDIFGEVGLFAVDQRRTQTALAVCDLELFWISGTELKRLCERNPGLSLYFLRLVATRLVSNASRSSPTNSHGQNVNHARVVTTFETVPTKLRVSDHDCCNL